MIHRRRRRPRYRFSRGGQKRMALVLTGLVVIVSVAVGFTWAWRDGLLFGDGDTEDVPMVPVVEFVDDAAPDTPRQSSSMTAASAAPAASASSAASFAASQSASLAGSGTEGMAFVGNSGISDLYVSGFIPDADYYYKVGLNVKTVFDTAMDQGTVPVIDELQGHDYNEVFLLFGQNELGWPAMNVFLEDYARVIAQAREYCPNATIYVMSILPMSEEASDRNDNGENQRAADEFNAALAVMAEENGAIFLDFTTDLKGVDGYLPADAAADGVHLNQTYLGVWADMIKDRVNYAALTD